MLELRLQDLLALTVSQSTLQLLGVLIGQRIDPELHAALKALVYDTGGIREHAALGSLAH